MTRHLRSVLLAGSLLIGYLVLTTPQHDTVLESHSRPVGSPTYETGGGAPRP